MLHKRAHLSEQELLLAADDELSPRRLAHARQHLAECLSCSARMSEIERTLTAATQACLEDLAAQLPPAASSRARLRARLAELSSQPRGLPAFWVGRWVLASGVLLAAGVGLVFLLAHRTTPRSFRGLDRNLGVSLLPRADLTPGVARPVSISEVCGSGRYGRTQPIPVSVHQTVFASYGADYDRAAEYELDYLITPELGGTSDAGNLWPQPYSRTPWNAYVKDELELHFHRLACDGEIDFVTAQREIAADWIAAYKRYFKTDRPLRDYATSPLTEHDSDLLLSELEELGISTHAGRSDGPTLMAMLQAARSGTHHPRHPNAGRE